MKMALMAHTVDYYQFLISPWSYLAIGRFNEIKKKTGAIVNYYPIDVMSRLAKWVDNLQRNVTHPGRIS